MSPVFNWKISGDGTPDSDTSANLSPSPTNPYGLANLPANLDFGATWDTKQTKTTQFTVDVKDSDGADASDTYTVTWHAPVEKWAALGKPEKGPNRIFPEPGKDSAGHTSIEVNRTVDVVIHTKENDLNYGPGLKVLSVFLGGASPFIPEMVAGPWGLALAGLAGAASVTTGFLVPSDPAQDHTPNGGTFYAE